MARVLRKLLPLFLVLAGARPAEGNEAAAPPPGTSDFRPPEAATGFDIDAPPMVGDGAPGIHQPRRTMPWASAVDVVMRRSWLTTIVQMKQPRLPVLQEP